MPKNETLQEYRRRIQNELDESENRHKLEQEEMREAGQREAERIADELKKAFDKGRDPRAN